MKIISMSDIHGDLESFDKALETVRESGAEVLTISGDLNGNQLSTEEIQKFHNAYQTLMNIADNINARNINAKGNHLDNYAVAQLIIKGQIGGNNDEGTSALKSVAEDYISLGEKAKENSIKNYEEFKQRFDSLEQRTLIVPGNWDTKNMDDILARYNIHNKPPEKVGGMKFVGYGESMDFAPGIPENLIIRFDSDEAFNHLSKYEDAEIALTYIPPRGFERAGRIIGGDSLLLAYLYRRQPDLIISGHTHKPSVFIEKEVGTFVVNPGLLGKYMNLHYGTFMEIDIDVKGVRPVRLYDLNGQTTDLRDKLPQ